MNKIFRSAMYAATLITLIGCEEKSEVEALAKNQLKDPDSAKFQKVIVSYDKKRACAIWNAKNGFGGYGAWETTEFVHNGERWMMKRHTGREDCSDRYYELREEFHKRVKIIRANSRVDDKTKQGYVGLVEDDMFTAQSLEDLINSMDDLEKASRALSSR